MFHRKHCTALTLPFASDEVAICLTRVFTNFRRSLRKVHVIHRKVPAFHIRSNVEDLICEISIIAEDHQFNQGFLTQTKKPTAIILVWFLKKKKRCFWDCVSRRLGRDGHNPLGSMHRRWRSRQAVRPRERDRHFWAVSPLCQRGHLKQASGTVPEEGRFSPPGATAGCQGYSLSLGAGGLQPGEGTYGPLSLSGWSPIPDVMNKRTDNSKTFCSYRFHDNRWLGNEKRTYLFFSSVSFEPFFSAYLSTFNAPGQC